MFPLIPSNSVLFYVWELLAVNTHKGTCLKSWLFDAEESCFVPKKFVISFPLHVDCLSSCKIQQRPSSLYTNFGEKEKALLYFDQRITVVESERQWFLLILFVGSSKPLSLKKKEMDGFFKYKRALLLKSVYRRIVTEMRSNCI